MSHRELSCSPGLPARQASEHVCPKIFTGLIVAVAGWCGLLLTPSKSPHPALDPCSLLNLMYQDRRDFWLVVHMPSHLAALK